MNGKTSYAPHCSTHRRLPPCRGCPPEGRQASLEAETPQHVTSVANRIGKLVRASVPKAVFDFESADYDGELVEWMEGCTVAELAADLANGVEPVEMLNGWLEDLYDWADRNRVWLG